MEPCEIEFIAENRTISVIPNFTYDKIYLICGEFGPFRAGLPTNVPLWLAVMLKQKQKCRIVPPDWMEVDALENIKEEEKRSSEDEVMKCIARLPIFAPGFYSIPYTSSAQNWPAGNIEDRYFTRMPHEHYMVEAKLVLGAAAEDVPRASEIKTIIKDIWDIRMSKLRTSMTALMKAGGSYGRLDHLTMMEINSVKPLLPAAVDQLLQIQMSAKKTAPASLNTSTFSQSGSASQST